MNKKTKNMIELYRNCSNLIKERWEFSDRINSLYSEMDEINSSNKYNDKELKSKISNARIDIKKKFINYFKYIFTIIIIILFTKSTFKGMKLSDVIISLIPYLLFMVPIIFCFFRFIGKYIAKIIYKFFGTFIENIFIKKYEYSKKELQEIELKNNKRIGEIKQEIKKLEESKKQKQEELDKIDLGELHKDYQNMNALSSFADYLEKGRCDNLKECINLYELETKENERNTKINQLQNQMTNIDGRIDDVKEQIGDMKGQIGDVNNQIGNIKNDLKDVSQKASKSLDLAETEAKMKTDEIGYEYGKAKLREISKKNYK